MICWLETSRAVFRAAHADTSVCHGRVPRDKPASYELVWLEQSGFPRLSGIEPDKVWTRNTFLASLLPGSRKNVFHGFAALAL